MATEIEARPSPDRPHYRCPVSASLSILGSRWGMLVVWHLFEQPFTFGALRRRIGGIGERMLTRELRRLAHHGVIDRFEVRGRVRYVRYSLSATGRQLRPAIDALWYWGRDHSGLVTGPALSADAPPNSATARGAVAAER